MNKKTKIILVIVAAVVVVVVAMQFFGKSKGFAVTYETAVIERGNINTSVTATGTVEPITQVEVGTQVSGIIENLYVDYNSVVKKGQVIAELDKKTLQSEYSTAKCNVETSQTEFNYQEKIFNRTKQLYEKELVSEYEFETAEYNYLKAKNDLQVAKNTLEKAATNLGYATIYAPIDGIVLSRDVEEGQTVASSYSTPTLFVIAQDLTKMRVIADVDEADIGGVLEGQRVTFTVDAYQGTIFDGEVIQVRQEATTTSNVVTYEVVINAPNPDLKLKPGLTANVTIYTQERNDVLLIPGKALSFTPSSLLIGPGDTIIDLQTPAKYKAWTRNGRTFQAHEIEVGLSTGSQTELISGLDEGERVVINIISGQMPGETAVAASDEQSNSQSSPFLPSPPGSKKK